MIGALLGISRVAHPEVAAAVTILCRYTHNPSKRHIRAAEHVLLYLKGSSHMGLRYQRAEPQNRKLFSFVDANWAGDLDNRHSTSALIVFFCGCLVSWVSQKQPIVATSSTEAEYIALSGMAKEIIFLRQFLNSIGFPEMGPTMMKADNKAANFLAVNAKVSSRTKHIGIKHHHIRELYHNKIIDIEYVETKNNLADIGTKPLAKPRFWALVQMFMYNPAAW